MPTTLESVVTKYLRTGSPAQRTREEYSTTLRKWSRWSGVVPLERLGRKEIRDFLIGFTKTLHRVREPIRDALRIRSARICEQLYLGHGKTTF
ncbi:hypothetical protein Q31a_08350 [Aureliella helgolandensis]|uniref:Core-binding (CB) domain-containing protein n=1 Tax=Aureliella helgolandensis TaxID=2527968 RepID=A0A518G1W7_9BACT|nr:hypothetical protein Q31a_08350 [Aureliella helgolandensis]